MYRCILRGFWGFMAMVYFGDGLGLYAMVGMNTI